MLTKAFLLAKLNFSGPQHSLFLLLLAYRWASLLPALWLFQAGSKVMAPGVSPGLLLTIVVSSTLIVTMFHRSLNRIVLANPLFLAVDIVSAAGLLAIGGATRSPYYVYALSPLLAVALFFQIRGGVLAAGGFTPLYLLALWGARQRYFIEVDLGGLFTQLAGIWLIPVLFGSTSELLRQLGQAHAALTVTGNDLTRQNVELAAIRDDLARQNVELAAAHRQLEITHDLTLLLQGASNTQAVQQRVLRAVTGELGFSQAIVGLVNPVTQRLEVWQSYPTNEALLAALAGMVLAAERDFLARVLLDRRGCWWLNEQPLVADEPMNAWFSQTPWLILPMVLQEQPVGVVLVAVEGGPGSLPEDRVAVLAAVVSQAAVALGTIDQTQRLAVVQERNRIARDIHDTIAQSLFGIVFTLDACFKMLPEQVDTVQQELLELRQLAEQIRQEVRQSILDIWPSELTLEQFKADLGKYVTHCAKPQAFTVDFTIGGDFDGLSAAIRRSLYRVAQEALTNVIHHAGVNSARVSLYVEPDQVYLSIRDQGRGFDPKVVLAREHNRERFGLRGIYERIDALGGTCEVLSQVDAGTQVLVQVPVRRNNHG